MQPRGQSGVDVGGVCLFAQHMAAIPPLSVWPCGTPFGNTQEGPDRLRSAPITDPLSVSGGFGIPNRSPDPLVQPAGRDHPGMIRINTELTQVKKRREGGRERERERQSERGRGGGRERERESERAREGGREREGACHEEKRTMLKVLLMCC